MATKERETKRGKKLATGKKMSKVKPLLKYNLTDVHITGIQTSGGSGGGIPQD